MHASSEPTALDLDLRDRLQLVPPGRIVAEANDSDDILTLSDLRQFAKFLAEEFRHHHDNAAQKPACWYEGMVEHCTPRQGELLREMTLEICTERNLLDQYVDARPKLKWTMRWARVRTVMGGLLNVTALVLFFGFLFGVIPALAGPQPGDPAAATPTDVPGVLSPAAFGFPVPEDGAAR